MSRTNGDVYNRGQYVCNSENSQARPDLNEHGLRRLKEKNMIGFKNRADGSLPDEWKIRIHVAGLKMDKAYFLLVI